MMLTIVCCKPSLKSSIAIDLNIGNGDGLIKGIDKDVVRITEPDAFTRPNQSNFTVVSRVWTTIEGLIWIVQQRFPQKAHCFCGTNFSRHHSPPTSKSDSTTRKSCTLSNFTESKLMVAHVCIAINI